MGVMRQTAVLCVLAAAVCAACRPVPSGVRPAPEAAAPSSRGTPARGLSPATAFVTVEGRGRPVRLDGRQTAANPEPMNTGRWNVDSGFAAAQRPGMTTIWSQPTEQDV
jgi:hypothetical protein